MLKNAIQLHREGILSEAIAMYRAIVREEPDRPDILNNLGSALSANGEQTEALEVFSRILEVAPDYEGAHGNIGRALQSSGDLQGAVNNYQRALRRTPDNVDLRYALGLCRAENGEIEAAIAELKLCITVDPGFARARYSLAQLLHASGDTGQAMMQLESFNRLLPDVAQSHLLLGIWYVDAGRVAEAEQSFQRAINLDDALVEAHSNLGNLYLAQGRNKDASQCYVTVIAAEPDNALAYRQLAYVSPECIDTTTVVALLKDPRTKAGDHPHLHFALAEANRARANHAVAFHHHFARNTIIRRSFDYDSAAFASYVDHTIAAFSSDLLSQRRNLGGASWQPLFIVGMPRSGTTLTESILASHSAIHGAGEVPFFRDTDRQLATLAGGAGEYPETIRYLDDSTAASLAQSYLASIEEGAEDATFIINKMPGNFLHIGLIKLLMPRARIICCSREARDNCLSIFFQSFSESHPYAHDLTELGDYYVQHNRLMAYWKQLFGDELFWLQYEDLVSDPETAVREMLSYLELPWETNCLRFFERDTLVQTASSKQVRKPIYQSAVGRWKRYQQWLSPLLHALQQLEQEH